MICGLTDKSGPESFHNKCCCVCKNRIKISYCTCGRCFSSDAGKEAKFHYVCNLGTTDGVVIPIPEHSVCEAFWDKRK